MSVLHLGWHAYFLDNDGNLLGECDVAPVVANTYPGFVFKAKCTAIHTSQLTRAILTFDDRVVGDFTLNQKQNANIGDTLEVSLSLEIPSPLNLDEYLKNADEDVAFEDHVNA